MAEEKEGQMQGQRVLVVEDEYMIAADFAYMLEKRGVEVVGPVGTVAEALELLDIEGPLDGAVLDINLGEEMVYPVADELRRRGVPFVFATGYSTLLVPSAHADVPRMEKPVNTGALVQLLANRIESFTNRSPQ